MDMKPSLTERRSFEQEVAGHKYALNMHCGQKEGAEHDGDV